MRRGETSDRQKNAELSRKSRQRFCNFATDPHIGERAVRFEAVPPEFKVHALLLRPGLPVGPRLPSVAGGRVRRFPGDAQGVADAAGRATRSGEISFSTACSAVESWVITTPDGGKVSCTANPSSLPFLRLRRLPAAWKPKAIAPLPVLPLAPCSPMRPTTTFLPARRSVRWPGARPATPVSATPATEHCLPRAARPDFRCAPSGLSAPVAVLFPSLTSP